MEKRAAIHSCYILAHLEGLPLDLSCSGNGLSLDEEGPRVDQLNAL